MSAWKMVLFSVLGLLGPLGMTGCYFGNYTQNVTNPDTISGYYETEPAALNFSVTSSSSTQSTIAATDASLIPSYLSDVLTDPVMLKMVDLGTGEAGILSEDGELPEAWLPYLPVTVLGPNGSMSGGVTPAQTVFSVTGCSLAFSLTARGNYGSPNGPFNSGATVPLSGRIQLAITADWNFSGASCATFLASCYANFTECQQSDAASNQVAQGWVKSAVDPAIAAATAATSTVVTTSNFQNFTDYSVSAEYQ